jgi:hypothetical protein
LIDTVEPRQAIPAGITASAIAHLSVLMLVVFFAEVHPFGSVSPELIEVDIVSPAQVAEVTKEPEPVPKPPEKPLPDNFSLGKSAASSPPASAAPSAASAASASAAAPPPAPSVAASQPQKQAEKSMPGLGLQPAAAQPPLPDSTAPAIVAPEPDISVKYQVLLGLPQARPGDGFDAPASEKAAVASNLITEFRRHLKTCSKLPQSIAASDKVRITLRVFMMPEGKLGAEPVLIEASASAKGPALMQGAISALQACQPYAMLPAERYGEWKVLDLSFTPQDFTGG